MTRDIGRTSLLGVVRDIDIACTRDIARTRRNINQTDEDKENCEAEGSREDTFNWWEGN